MELSLSINTTKQPPRFIITCDLNTRHLVKLACLGTASWSKALRAYTAPADNVIIHRLMELLPDIKVDDEVWEWASEIYDKQRRAITAVQDTSPLTSLPLWPFQNASVRFLEEVKKGILAHDMGTGKTVISCVALDYVQADKVIIVCPNAVKWSWVDHIQEWCNEKKIYVLESSPSPEISNGIRIISGNKSKREATLLKVLNKEDEFVIIMNYEQMRIHEENFKDFDYDVIIGDEAHRINNRQSQRSQSFRKLAGNSHYVWLLTGTPVRNNYGDLWSLLSVCDSDRFTSFWNFVNLHLTSVPGTWGGVEIIGLRDPERFNSMLATHMFRVTKEEAMPDLPDKIYNPIRLVMEEKQSYHYEQMEKEFMLYIEKELDSGKPMELIMTAPNTAAQLVRLRQLALSPELVGIDVPSAKLEALKDIVHDIEGSFILFCCYREFIYLVADILEDQDIPYGMIVGGQSTKQREEVLAQLNNGEIRAVLGTIHSMGEGLNLQAASTAIFCDRDWVPAVNIQAEDRIHRGDIKTSPVIIELFHPGTVESDIRTVNKRKESVIDETSGQVELVREMLTRRGGM